jgi:aryl-alcohol dehydrogenase-like predicted oxidoreductase
MRERSLGKNGPKVSAIGLGCMGMSQSYGGYDDAESTAALRRALELGVMFWDSADIYGNGANETLLSGVLAENRGRVFIATKFGFRAKDGKLRVDASPAWMREAVEGSLRRLKTDVIDLYYAHRVDPNVPVEETVGAMAELVKTGKVRHIGLSECTEGDLRKAHAVHPITAVQSEYSLLERQVERNGVLEATKELGVAFVPFAPLARALMTNKLDMAALKPEDFRYNIPRYNGAHRENNEKLAAGLARLAAGKGVTAAQLSLAWILAQGEHVIPIPGTKRAKHLEENAGSADVELTQSDLASIESLLAKLFDVKR